MKNMLNKIFPDLNYYITQVNYFNVVQDILNMIH